jgi:hypothetical protein
VKIFLAAYSGDPELTDLAAEDLFREFRGGVLGAPDVQSPDMPMPSEAYYAPEMGTGLVKRYLSSPARLEPGALVELKLLAMDIESRRLSPSGGRKVNLDPGYLSLGGLVLSTGKCAGHRLWLGRGVWGELTLSYRKGSFSPLPWTYRDYRDPAVLRHLAAMRRILVADSREERKAAAGPSGPDPELLAELEDRARAPEDGARAGTGGAPSGAGALTAAASGADAGTGGPYGAGARTGGPSGTGARTGAATGADAAARQGPG